MIGFGECEDIEGTNHFDFLICCMKKKGAQGMKCGAQRH